MRVRAIQLGYYGHKRRPEGTEFVLEPIKRIRKQPDGTMKEILISPEQQFSVRWMEKVDTPKKEKPKE
jgi:hypothetical protein